MANVHNVKWVIWSLNCGQLWPHKIVHHFLKQTYNFLVSDDLRSPCHWKALTFSQAYYLFPSKQQEGHICEGKKEKLKFSISLGKTTENHDNLCQKNILIRAAAVRSWFCPLGIWLTYAQQAELGKLTCHQSRHDSTFCLQQQRFRLIRSPSYTRCRHEFVTCHLFWLAL